VDKMTKAKTRLVIHQPFFSVLALGLTYVETEMLPTMATDGKHIYWNPDFVEKLTIEECAGVIAHEVMHVAWLHMLRRGHRDPLLWNLACDYAINPVVLSSGLHLPLGKGYTKDNPDYCHDPKYKDWSAYSIYEDLLKNAEKNAKGISLNGDPKDGSGGPQDGQKPLWGEVMDATGKEGKALSESEKRELEEEIKINVKQAAESAKARGKLPAGMEGLIAAVGKPKIDWKDYIQNWVSGRIPDNYTWVKPNRRMMVNYDIYMPSMQLNGAGIGVLSIDTSGSVSDKELQEYITEIVGVIEICNPEKLYIIQHDAIVQKVDEWNAGDDFSKLHIKGRGGTCIKPSFEKVKEFDETIDWMICFTDMGICDFPSAEQAPEFPVLWAATGPDNAPFGTYIPIRDAMQEG